MFFWTAEKAKSNFEKYERKMDRKELKAILLSIDKASKEGYNVLEWDARIREGVIYLLENAGYEVDRIAKERYAIYW